MVFLGNSICNGVFVFCSGIIDKEPELSVNNTFSPRFVRSCDVFKILENLITPVIGLVNC